jgi:hypothetical protein
MRLTVRMWVAAGACALASAAALALAGPASAKGIQSATITGPGLDEPIDVPPSEGDGGRLAALTAVWEVMPGQPQPPGLSQQAPTGQLGRRYTVTWRLMTGPDETTAIRQDVYPDAAGGPLVHTAAGQPIFDGTTVGGWYEAPSGLRDMLRALGVPPAGTALVEPSAATPSAELAPSPRHSPWPGVMFGAAGALALAGVGGAVAIRARRARRRERVAPIPL